MMRPRGSPPMPSAMSRPREPVDKASTSMRSLAPSRMMEPLPCSFSIWARAASNAFCLSMLPPSTTRSCGFSMGGSLIHELRIGGKGATHDINTVHFLFRTCNRCLRLCTIVGRQQPADPVDAAGSLAAKAREQRPRPHAEHRVRPARGDLQERDKDEGARVEQRMREHKAAAL